MEHSPSIEWQHANQSKTDLVSGKSTFCWAERGELELYDTSFFVHKKMAPSQLAVAPLRERLTASITSSFARTNLPSEIGRMIFPARLMIPKITRFSYGVLSRVLPREPGFHAMMPALTVLPDERYILVQPIPVQLERDEEGEWTASFQVANISMSGSDPYDAQEALAEDIVAAFELYLEEEENLGPGPQQELAVLRQYIRILP